MCSAPERYDLVKIFIVFTVTSNIIHVSSSVTNDTTYFHTRQLSGQQYGLEYNLRNYTNAEKTANRPRTLFDWDSPAVSSERETKVQTTKVLVNKLGTERVENNVWWPWKNYDEWLNGRGLKAKQPNTSENKPKRGKKNKKNNKKNGKKRKKSKNGKKQQKLVDGDNGQPSTVVEDNEVTKKGSVPEIQYKKLSIDMILKNSTLDPTLLKYSSRNYTYDVNECLTNNGGCEGLCINTPGSYRCHCPPGFMVADTKCEDVDECLLRNGHGPCQGTCANTWGGYECSCRGVPGTRLAGDGHACDDVDECRDGTAGCSHQCINTVGSAFCVCPDGLQLDAGDWKTCVDVDECSDPELQRRSEEGGCADRGLACRNTYGSYECA